MTTLATSPRMTTTVEAIRLGATIVGTLATFIPAAIALIVQWERATPLDLAIVAVPVIASAIAWVTLGGARRSAVTVVAGYAMLIGQFELTSSGGPIWPPIASSTFAVSVIAIGGLSTRVAIASIGTSALLCYVGVEYYADRLTLISTDLLGGLITPLVDIALGASFLLALTQWSRTADSFDATMDAIRREAERAQLELEVDHARRAVDRRMHETVLNTLLVLSGSPEPAAAQEQSRRDLATLDQIEAEVSRDLHALVVDAASQVPSVTVSVTQEGTATLTDSRSAGIVRDAVVEVLRNVERHSGTMSARLDMLVGRDTAVLRIQDSGVGMEAPAPSGFGSSESVRRSVQSIGGSVTWTSAPGKGTAVEMCIPLQATQTPTLGRPSLDILLAPVWARVALNPTIAVGIVAVPAAVHGFARAWLIGLMFTVQVVGAAVLVARQSGQVFVIARAVTIGAALATMLAAAHQAPDCATAVPMHWIVFSAAGGVVLAILSMRTWPARFAAILAVIAVSVFVSVQYPPQCVIDPLDAALENAVWLVVIISIVGGLTSVADRARALAERDLDSASARRTANTAAAAAAERWRAVSPTTRALLRDVAEKRAALGTPGVQTLAVREEARLRSILELGRLESTAAREFCEEVLTQADAHGVTVNLRVNGAGPTTIPTGLAEGLGELLRGCSRDPIDVTILDETCLCTVRCAGAPVLPAPWSLLDVRDDGTRVLEWSPTTGA